MDFLTAKKKHDELVKLIERYAREYYVLDNPSVDDAVYDQKMEELEAIEKEWPELITRNSPTQRIIGTVLKGFNKINHQVQMLSLSDVVQPETTVTVYDYIKQSLGQQKQMEYLTNAAGEIAASLDTEENVERKKKGADLDKLLNW